MAFIDLGSDVVTLREDAHDLNTKYDRVNLRLRGFGNGESQTIGKKHSRIIIDEASIDVDVYIVPNEAQDEQIIIGRGMLITKDETKLVIERKNDETINEERENDETINVETENEGSINEQSKNMDSMINENEETTYEKNLKVRLELEEQEMNDEIISNDSNECNSRNVTNNFCYPVNKTLNDYEKQQLRGLISRNEMCFATGFANIGLTSDIEMKIELTSDTPVTSRPYRLPYRHREIVTKTVTELFQAGIICESNSSYSSPVVLVSKKTGGERMCVDYRRLNAVTKKEYVPMTNIDEKLDQKDNDWHWEEEQERAFQSVKDELAKRPILTLYDSNADFEIHTDASKIGLAGILFQSKPNEVMKPVSYFSRQTSELEQKFHSYELEALAVVESLERFRVYVLGRKFKVVTDCNSLKMMMKKKDITPRIGRWILKLQEYDFEVEHRIGTLMAHVDVLSRNPHEPAREVKIADFNVLTLHIDNSDWLLTMQLQDHKLKTILDILRKRPLTNEEKQIHEDYELKDNRICRKAKEGLRWVVPNEVRWRVIKGSHDDMGHYGLERTLLHLQKYFWFSRMRKKVKSYIDSCIECAYQKNKTGKLQAQLHNIERLPIPFHTVNVDHLGPFPKSTKGNIHILKKREALEKIEITQQKQKERFDKKCVIPRQYKEGDIVLIKREPIATGESRKLQPLFKGPYVIVETLGQDQYVLSDIEGAERTQRPFKSVYSADRMKPWCQLSEIEENATIGDDGEGSEAEC
ncbi:uncharacterized protein [Onthophagus taurus]|uniref:uncharacterized protein n=1 Tax=Onthophagus taurus TaxID=166361 RepID=UPI0039BDB42E